MKKVFACLLFLLSFALTIPRLTYAHFPATDGPITVILHVDPNDSPIPQQRAVLHFLFEDSTKHFNFTKCQCLLTISAEGKQLLSQRLTKSSQSASSIWDNAIPFVFPQREVYHITLTGTPKIKNAFHAFRVNWYLRVDQYPQAQEAPGIPFIWFVMLYIGIFIVTGVVILIVLRL